MYIYIDDKIGIKILKKLKKKYSNSHFYFILR